MTSERRAFVYAAVVASLAAVPVGGCRGIVGIEDAPPTFVTDAGADVAPAPASCGVSSPNPTCASCITTSCCAEAQRCASAPGCADLSGCIAACAPGDVACASDCRVRRFPNSYGAEASALASCEADKCAAACAITCGGYTFADATCGAWAVQNCCVQATTCMRSAECAAVAACERACAEHDASCLQGCELAHPTGVNAERDLGECLHKADPDGGAAPCIESRWECLRQQATQPPVAAGPFRIRYRILEYPVIASSRAKGLTLRACRRNDPDCTILPVLAGPVITDQWGEAELTFAETFDGYVEITGPGYGTVLVYLPPVAKDFTTFFGVANEATFTDLGDALTAPGGLQPDRGNVIVGVFDCAGGDGDGVRLSLDTPDAASTPFYFVGGSPSQGTMTTADPDTGAYGGFLNVSAAPLRITVDATVVKNGLALPTRPVYARAGRNAYTIVLFYPGLR
jgi:hypothetical protein